MADSKQFTLKGKPVIYIRAFVELYNQKNNGQVYDMHWMIKLEKIHASFVENL